MRPSRSGGRSNRFPRTSGLRGGSPCPQCYVSSQDTAFSARFTTRFESESLSRFLNSLFAYEDSRGPEKSRDLPWVTWHHFPGVANASMPTGPWTVKIIEGTPNHTSCFHFGRAKPPYPEAPGPFASSGLTLASLAVNGGPAGFSPYFAQNEWQGRPTDLVQNGQESPEWVAWVKEDTLQSTSPRSEGRYPLC